jgi:hypothetical protein
MAILKFEILGGRVKTKAQSFSYYTIGILNSKQLLILWQVILAIVLCYTQCYLKALGKTRIIP